MATEIFKNPYREIQLISLMNPNNFHFQARTTKDV